MASGDIEQFVGEATPSANNDRAKQGWPYPSTRRRSIER